MQSNGHMKSYAALVSWDILGPIYADSHKDTCTLMDTCIPIGYIRYYGHMQTHAVSEAN